mmetsp:Transcript_41005/g.53735  ORF Transcript_41005/g.53735 Transcript_41005/m.53735 type:complete len:96 (-) Transcript_41005:1502-1789(-)|eukprot:CAMPEP_0185567702 /NCGR_PEP_ID=MMETSP0434-20130131/881_1 /TAXON_ID=626734 ORGANISM="Favella taraikaensis, Strain Fe Narragansett Bay" /NCGR_SAMPLE_ID=MMETSP0434 /ASSEMBLY_ACC=CAM_ASM_000379 /LENGTH=95 /DNA_ID=CAMNT_0028181987 /DNA_START=110 /DNA_END=397 /DNA_ORIENTATION=-
MIGFFKGTYSVSNDPEYSQFTENGSPWMIDTKTQTLAGLVREHINSKILGEHKPYQVFRIQFYQYYLREDGSYEYKWLDAAYCRDIYKDLVEADE